MGEEQESGFGIQGRSAGPALWTCGSSKAGVGRAGFRCQVSGERGSMRIQESEARSQNEEHLLSAFRRLLAAYCVLWDPAIQTLTGDPREPRGGAEVP